MTNPPEQPGYNGPAPGQPGWGPPPSGFGAPGGYGSPGYPPAPPGAQGFPGPPPPGYGPEPYPGGFGPPPPFMEAIPTYLWQSIAATLLCCLPAGVVAIVYASRVSNLQQIGDIAGALEASRKAKMWCIISVVAAVVATVIYFLVSLLLFGALLGWAEDAASTSTSTVST